MLEKIGEKHTTKDKNLTKKQSGVTKYPLLTMLWQPALENWLLWIPCAGKNEILKNRTSPLDKYTKYPLPQVTCGGAGWSSSPSKVCQYANKAPQWLPKTKNCEKLPERNQIFHGHRWSLPVHFHQFHQACIYWLGFLLQMQHVSEALPVKTRNMSSLQNVSIIWSHITADFIWKCLQIIMLKVSQSNKLQSVCSRSTLFVVQALLSPLGA